MSGANKRQAREFVERARAALTDEMRGETWDDAAFAAGITRAVEVWRGEGWSDSKIEAALAPIRSDADDRRRAGLRWSEAEINAVLVGGQGSVVWARGRQRRSPGKAVTTVDHGADPIPNVERVVRRLEGRAGGRPPGQSSITDDDQLRPTIREMRRDRIRTTMPNVAARASFTVAEIRGYLKLSGRSWEQFLNSF